MLLLLAAALLTEKGRKGEVGKGNEFDSHNYLYCLSISDKITAVPCVFRKLLVLHVVESPQLLLVSFIVATEHFAHREIREDPPRYLPSSPPHTCGTTRLLGPSLPSSCQSKGVDLYLNTSKIISVSFHYLKAFTFSHRVQQERP